MATPFTVFRRYTGPAMAVLCGFLMIAFVVADPLMQYVGSGAGGGNARAGETVAVWRGGEINERQLAEAVFHRRLLAEFQRQVLGMGQISANEAGVGDLPLRVQPMYLPSTAEEGVENDVVRTKVFAEKAEEAGMVVSDQMVSEYLHALGRDRVNTEDMRTIVGQLSSGSRRASINFIFDLMREALLARNYLASHRYAFSTVVPAERWEDWLRLYDRVVIEASPVPAESFLDKVGEPSDAELAAYFAEFRDVAPLPDVLREYGNVELPSPDPAFATPERVRMQYVVLDYEKVLEETLDEVTDEEIAEFYEQNKDRFINADDSLFGGDDLFGEETQEEGAEESTETETGEESAADPAMEEPGAEEAEGTATDSTEAETDDASEESRSADPSEETSTEPASEAETTPAADTSESPATETVEEEEEEEEEATEEAGAADSESDSTESDSSVTASEEASGEEAGVTYQPLDEVRDEIRRVIAQVKADEKISERAMELKRGLDEAFEDYFGSILDAEDAGNEPPEPPQALADLSELAAEEGLRHESTGEVSIYDLRDTPFGMSLDADPRAAVLNAAGQTAPMFFRAFRDQNLERHKPAISYDRDNNIYLSVLDERLDRVEPELDDVRDQVVEAWKLAKAGELALKHAKQLAGEATTSGKTLSEFFSDHETQGVVETAPVSFLEIVAIDPNTGRLVTRLSQPEPLIAPGPDLLKTVFGLDDAEAGAALNHDHSVAYVVKVAQRLTGRDELRQRFVASGGSWRGAVEATQSRFAVNRDTLIDDLMEASELEWLREADAWAQ